MQNSRSFAGFHTGFFFIAGVQLAMEYLSSYALSLPADAKKRYLEKINSIGGLDPFNGYLGGCTDAAPLLYPMVTAAGTLRSQGHSSGYPNVTATVAEEGHAARPLGRSNF